MARACGRACGRAGARALAVPRADPVVLCARALAVPRADPVVRDAIRLSGAHLFIFFLSDHFGYRRLAVHLHMSVGRVVFGPHRIGWVPSQLIMNWAPVRAEPSIKIIKIYGKIVF